MTAITLEMLRKQFMAARSRAALIPGLADMLTALEAHLVIQAEHHRRLEDMVRELGHDAAELTSRVRTIESIVSTVRG